MPLVIGAMDLVRARNGCFVSLLVVAAFASLFAGCATKDSFTRDHQVGNAYEVVGNLCIIDDMLKDEQMTDVAGWQVHAEKFNKRFVKMPLGTRIKIIAIEKRTQSSWNTGKYSYHVVGVNALIAGHEGIRYDASHLIYGTNFGNGGGQLITLKAVSSENTK